jgi:peptide/nickel transport system permease protein
MQLQAHDHAAMAVFLGVLIGVIAGWYGRYWDEVLMRFMDGLSAFPNLLLALSLVAITGGAVINIILVVGIVGTPWVAPVILQARLATASAILLEALLSFLGVGVKPPTPTWGACCVVPSRPWTRRPG